MTAAARILVTFIAGTIGGALAASPGQQAGKIQFELSGVLLDADGKPFRNVTPVIFLHGATSPFAAQTLADRAGKFKFKKLKPALYTVIAAVPQAGELRMTVDVSAGRADSKGRIDLRLLWKDAQVTRQHDVAASQLSVPASVRGDYAKALKCLESRDVAAAVVLLEKAVRDAPSFTMAWNSLGVIAYQTARYADAERYFREALKQEPSSYNPLVNLGGALLALRRYEESLEVNLRAVRARPAEPLAHSQLGSSYLHLGRLDLAEEHLKQAISLEPGHFSLPHLKLAQVYERMGYSAAVVEQLEEFLRLHPDAPQAADVRKLLEADRARIKP